ncbi:MAG TPA: hypothetical protein VM431_03520 [Phycisphaerae bacterium]|nr:hypothetical protein [Phycisphaerae bacterium]
MTTRPSRLTAKSKNRAQVHRPERVAGQTLAVYERIAREHAGG